MIQRVLHVQRLFRPSRTLSKWKKSNSLLVVKVLGPWEFYNVSNAMHFRTSTSGAQGPASKLYGSDFAKWEIVPPVVLHSVWFMKFCTSPRVPARLIQVIAMSLDRPVPRRLIFYPISSCKCILAMLVGHRSFKRPVQNAEWRHR